MDLEKHMAQAQAVYGAVPKCHNCAQAVVEIAGRKDLYESMAFCGAGRAENGYCGALFGALQVTPEANHDAVKAHFAEQVGALTCKEIKGTAKTPCMKCVAVGAMLAEEFGK